MTKQSTNAMFPDEQGKQEEAKAVAELGKPFDLLNFANSGAANELREELSPEEAQAIDGLTNMGSGIEGSDWWKILQKSIPDPNNPKVLAHVPGEYYRGEGGDVSLTGTIIESSEVLIGAVPCALPNARSMWLPGSDRPTCWSEDGITASYDVPDYPFEGWDKVCANCSECAANRSDDKGQKLCKTKPRFLMIGVDDKGNLDPEKQIILVASFFSSTIWWDFTKTFRKCGVDFSMFLYEFGSKVEEFGKDISQKVAGINPEIIRPLTKEEYRIVADAAFEIVKNKGRWNPPRLGLAAASTQPALAVSTIHSTAKIIGCPADAMPADKPRDFGAFPVSDGKFMNRFQLIKNITGVAKDSLGWEREELDSWIKIRPYGKELMLEDMSDDQIRFVTAELGEIIGITKNK